MKLVHQSSQSLQHYQRRLVIIRFQVVHFVSPMGQLATLVLLLIVAVYVCCRFMAIIMGLLIISKPIYRSVELM